MTAVHLEFHVGSQCDWSNLEISKFARLDSHWKKGEAEATAYGFTPYKIEIW